jgi:hypothetical protein
MEEIEKQAVEFALKVFAKQIVRWSYGLWIEFHERRSGLILLTVC